jgi:hypothetical protein
MMISREGLISGPLKDAVQAELLEQGSRPGVSRVNEIARVEGNIRAFTKALIETLGLDPKAALDRALLKYLPKTGSQYVAN